MKRSRMSASSELASAIEALEQAVETKKKDDSATTEGLTALLIKATCDETTAIWQYFVAKYTARGAGRLDALPEYDEHINDEWEHLFLISDRLQQLGGKPVFDIAEVNEIGHEWERVETKDVNDQLAILIKAEDNAVAFYKEIVRYAGSLGDEVTKQLFKKILADETDHSFELMLVKEELADGDSESDANVDVDDNKDVVEDANADIDGDSGSEKATTDEV